MDLQIQSLQRQRRATQIKVFTKWVNTHLTTQGLEVTDLVQDMSDGVRLHRLIESITGQSVGRLNPGKQRFHQMDNINRSLNFLSKRFALKGISAEDIVGAKSNAILALLWLIFLNLQMNTTTPSKSNGSNSFEVPSAPDDEHSKTTLLKWCQMQISTYPGVRVEDFTRSWMDGMAFSALIHRFRPDLLCFEELDPSDVVGNLSRAFRITEEKLGIPKFIEAEDMVKEKVDEDTVVIFLAYLFQTFYRPKQKPVEVVEEVVMVKKPAKQVEMVNDKTDIPQAPLRAPPVVRSQPPNLQKQMEPIQTANVELVIFPDSWECGFCSFMNTPITQICAICFTKKSPDSVLAKNKTASTTAISKSPVVEEKQDVASDSDEWTEEDEILKRPHKIETVSSQRISITLESPDAAPPDILPPENDLKSRPVNESHPDDWVCKQCEFRNPFITKICGACFGRRNADETVAVTEIQDQDGNTIASDF